MDMALDTWLDESPTFDDEQPKDDLDCQAHPHITASDEEAAFELLSQAAPENSELHDYYMLVQTLLLNSVVEMHRPVGMKREPDFWRSRYADFFIDLMNTMRDAMGMDPICAKILRVGISVKFNKPEDWLLPKDGLSEDQIAAECARYALMWSRIAGEHPDGIDDEASNYLFTPNRPGKGRQHVAAEEIPAMPSPISLVRQPNQEAPRVAPRTLAKPSTVRHSSWMMGLDDDLSEQASAH